jgi:lysophospholipase L1-like esterase
VHVLNKSACRYTSTRLKSDFERIIARATATDAAPTLLFTIFIGANDACIMGDQEYVPWPTFSANIRYFIETILTQDALANTKIVVITPPPINGTEAKVNENLTQEDVHAANEMLKEGQRYRTYMSKKRYAEGLMEIAGEYGETGRVVGVNFWRGIVEKSGLGGEWEDMERSGMWPGSSLLGAKSFEDGWFTDGLHLDRKGYGVLNDILMEAVVGKWPELAPEKLESV